MPNFTVEYKAALFVDVDAANEEQAKEKSRDVAYAASRSFDSISIAEEDWIVIDPNHVVGVTRNEEDEDE